nr:MAG TPA: tail tape measure [Bacteriophage sp.]
MATVGDNLKANIRIGGTIDPSWKKSVDGLKHGLSGATQEVARLTRQQDVLKRKIQAGVLAGQDITELRKQYEKLGKKIHDAAGEQDKFNRKLARAERLERWKGRAGTVLKTGFGLSVGSGLTLAAGTTAVLNRNTETAERAGIARSYGVDYETYAAWDSLARLMGLNGENIGDLFEEYRNKVFDDDNGATDKGAIQEVFGALGLKAGVMAGKSNQEQVEFLFDRLLQVENEQVAAGMADALFGGEANKILTWMRLSGKTYRELISEQKRYNLVTKAGADGAVQGHMALSNLSNVLSSSIDEISGQLGKELAPHIQQVTDDLAAWFKYGGLEKIRAFIRDDALPALIDMAAWMWKFGKVLAGITQKAIEWGLADDPREDRREVLEYLAKMGSPELARAVAQKNGQGEWFDELIRQNPDLTKQVVQAYKDTRGYFPWNHDDKKFDAFLDPLLGPKEEPDFKAIKEKSRTYIDGLPAAGQGQENPDRLSALQYTPGSISQVEVKPTYQIRAEFNITQKSGEDAGQLADRVTKNLGDINFGQRSRMTDGYESWG